MKLNSKIESLQNEIELLTHDNLIAFYSVADRYLSHLMWNHNTIVECSLGSFSSPVILVVQFIYHYLICSPITDITSRSVAQSLHLMCVFFRLE